MLVSIREICGDYKVAKTGYFTLLPVIVYTSLPRRI